MLDMPVYIYHGRDTSGSIIKGEMEATDEKTLRLLLQRKHIVPTKVKVKTKPIGQNLGTIFSPKVKQNEIVIFTRQLSTMIDSGLPLIQGLDALARQQDNPKFKEVLTQIKTDVETGSTFAEALKKHPALFDRLYVNMVAAGEVGGILDTVMARLAVYMEKAQRLKRKVKSAMTYPIIVLAISALVLGVILIFVIPSFTKLFKDSGKALPLPTQLVVNLSDFVVNYFFLIIVGIGFIVFAIKQYYKTPNGRKVIDAFLLRAPIFGVLFRKVAVAKMTRTLGTLITSGVSILESLNVAAGTAGNKIIEDAILKVKASVTEGKSIAQPLEEAKVFPPMVVQMIAVGEATGALDQMMNKIADFYDEEVDVAVDGLTAMIEPLMILFLGGTVGSIIIAMYLPIFQMASIVAG